MSDELSYPDYVGPTDADRIDRAFDRILKALVTRDAEFMFGAGMSKARDVPTGFEVLQRLLKIYFPSSGSNRPPDERITELAYEYPFEAIVEAVMNNLGKRREDLTNHLKQYLLEPEFPESEAHSDFVSICYWGGMPRLNRIFTTNFDRLLETEISDDRAVTITEDNTKEIRKAQEKGLIPVIHLHGTLDSKYEITETDIFSEGYKAVNNELRSALNDSDAFVFVGYSMNDPDFRRLYMSYRDDISSREERDKITYFVSPPRDGFSYRLGIEIWKSRKAEWIPLDAKWFFKRLRNLIRTKSDKQSREIIMKKFNLSDEEALNDMIGRVAKVLRTTHVDALQFLLHYSIRYGGR